MKGGFELPAAKSDVSWVDPDTLVVGTDWGAGSLTESGYPRVVKVWRRGKPLATATTLFEGKATDVAVRSFVDQDGGAHPFVVRATSFFEAEYHYAPGLGVPSKLPLPLNSDIQGVLDGRAIFSLRTAWDHQGKLYPQGSVVAYDLKRGTAEPVFAASDTQSIEAVAVGKTGLVVQFLENVSGKAVRIARTPQGEWRGRPSRSANGVLKIASAGGGTDDAMLSFESLTSPLTLYYVVRTPRSSRSSRRRPPTMQPTSWSSTVCHLDRRHEIPYFVMGKKAVLAKGNAPTVQYAYGGFLNATLPVYYEDPSRPQHGALAGKLWVSRGGVLVLANIRGGSEYGPRWHDAGLKGIGRRCSTTSSRFPRT